MSDQQFNRLEERQREAPEAFSTEEKPQNRAWERISRLVKRLKPGQILTIGFFSVVMLGALLLTLPVATIDRETLGFVDALFTATSAVCVTGLTVVNTGVTFSLFGQVVIILLIQVGGLGFMTMASLVFLAIGRRISLRERLIIQESFNTDSLQGLVRLVRNAILVTLVIEGIGFLIFSLRFLPAYGWGKGLFYALFMSISAFCNAGFDPFGFANSIEPFVADPVVNLTVMLLITLGGMGFSVILDILRHRRFRLLMLHSRIVLVMTGILFLSGWLLTLLLEWDNPATLGKLPPAVRVMAAAFQSVTLRTAGFDTIGQGGLTPAGQMVAIIHMFIGASPASTGGGIKTTTFFVVFLSVAAMVRRKTDYNVYRRRLNEQLIRRALAIFTLALTLVLFDTVVISAVEGVAGAEDTLADVLYETVSAFATVGLTTGITPTLSVVSKLLISLTMFLGRVGPLTVSMALSGGPQKPDAIRYPEERLMVG